MIRTGPPVSVRAAMVIAKLDGIITVMSPEPATREESSMRPPASNCARILPAAAAMFKGPEAARIRTIPMADSAFTPRAEST